MVHSRDSVKSMSVICTPWISAATSTPLQQRQPPLRVIVVRVAKNIVIMPEAVEITCRPPSLMHGCKGVRTSLVMHMVASHCATCWAMLENAHPACTSERLLKGSHLRIDATCWPWHHLSLSTRWLLPQSACHPEALGWADTSGCMP